MYGKFHYNDLVKDVYGHSVWRILGTVDIEGNPETLYEVQHHLRSHTVEHFYESELKKIGKVFKNGLH
jgi:hypothetical protein